MMERLRVLSIALVTLVVFWPAVHSRGQLISTAHDEILRATQRALTALLTDDSRGYGAGLHPDFLHMDPTGRPLSQTEENQKQWGFVTLQKFVTNDQRTAQMQLIDAPSTITSISIPSENEAVVIGEEVLRWQGKHGEDIRQTNADGSVAMISNTETRTVIVIYRRQWVRNEKGVWQLKRSQIDSEHIVAVM